MTDAAFVARFEEVVQAQRPASQPWAPVTDYSAAGRAPLEAPHADRIVATFHPVLVYDVGCGPGHLVRLLEARGVPVIGFDKHPQGNAAELDIADGPVRAEPADLVICREVLEHLTIRDVARAVRHLCDLSSRFVYGTTRFSSEHDLLRVETHDELDPTHITLMSKDLLKVLFVLEGFIWRQDLADQMDWKGYKRTFVFERVS